MSFHRLDIRHPDLAKAVRGADIVVHLAFVLGTGRDSALVSDVNLGGLRNVLAAMSATDGPRHLVYPSSAFAYGAHEDNPPLLTEDLPLRPNEGSVMGELKAQSEEEIFRWDVPESSVAILRLALVFGPRADTFYSRLLESPIVLSARGRAGTFSVVHEEDAAAALHHAITHRLAGVYNVCADDPISWSDIGSVAGKREVEVAPGTLMSLVRGLYAAGFVDLPPGEVPYQLHRWVLSNDKLRRTGWEPMFSGRDALAETAKAHAGYVSVGMLRATRAQWTRSLLATAAAAAAVGVAAGAMGARRRRH